MKYLIAVAIACLGLGPASAAQVTQVGLGSIPSANDRRAFPEAQCIWSAQYDATLRFVRQMTFGINRRTGMQTLEKLSQPCISRRANPRGDIIAALHYVRDGEVARCMERTSPRMYRRLHSKLKGKEKSRAVTDFLENGFPSDILAAANRCDPDLAAPLETEARKSWWGTVFARPM